MKVKRWTLGVVLAVAVSVFGLIQADASPFATYLLSDDIGNQVRGSAPEAGDWGSEDGNGNNGHGNNEDGVDSSNQGNSKADEDTNCDGDGNCVDDEMGSGDSGNKGNGNNGKKKK